MRTPFCLLFLSEHIRHAYVSAKATVFSSVAVNADIRLPRVGLGSFHPQAQFAPDAAAFHAGRPDGRDGTATRPYRAFRFAVEFVLIGQAAVPVPQFVGCSVPCADPQYAALYAVQIVVLQRVKLCAVTFGVEVFPVYVQALAFVILEDFSYPDVGAEIIGMDVITVSVAVV